MRKLIIIAIILYTLMFTLGCPVNVGLSGESPKAPSNFQLELSGKSCTPEETIEVKLSWTGVVGDNSAFETEVSTDGTTWTIISKNLSAGTVSDSFNAQQGTRYQFRVRAVNNIGVSEWVSGSLNILPPITGTTPENNTTLSQGYVELGWSAVSGAASYQIQTASTKDEVANAGLITAYTPIYLLSSTQKSTFWRVRAVDSAGAKSAWNSISAVCLNWGTIGRGIKTVQELLDIASGGDMSGDYYLTGDINVTDVDWTPIGNKNTPFTGTFNGNGYAITNLDINTTTDYQGFFAYTGENALIHNVTLKDITITGRKYIGGLIGDANKSTVKNCSISGTIVATGHEFYEATGVGGLIGKMSGGSIESSSFQGFIQGIRFVGGLAGYLENNGTITGSSAKIDLTTTGNSYFTGGLVGYMQQGTVEKSYSRGSLKGHNNTGGLIGSVMEGTVRQCFSDTNVTGGYSYTGGLIGDLYAYEKYIYVTDCYVRGDVNNTNTAISNPFVGGLFGFPYNENDYIDIQNCYVTGAVTVARENSYTGPLAGIANNMTNCVFDIETVGRNGAGALTTAAMKSQETFLNLGWNFSGKTAGGIWAMDGIAQKINDGYPYLINNPPPEK